MNIHIPVHPVIPSQVWMLVWAIPLSRNQEVFRYFARTYLCGYKTENGSQFRTGNKKKRNFFHKIKV